MTDKELNMAILDQLYVIADAVWAKMENEYEGSFTAAYINTNIEKYFWWGEVDKGNSHSIEVVISAAKFPRNVYLELCQNLKSWLAQAVKTIYSFRRPKAN